MSILPAWMLPLVLLAPAAAWASTPPPSTQEASRVSAPLETVIADLEAFVPEYMEQESVPGVAIALLREGRIAWVRGFGSANRWTRRPVQADTVFEVASISKVMTAFIALRLVDQGQLDLDVPLSRYLAEPWLPPSPYRDVITLRQCLSHSAGFGHNTTSRETLFPPGSRYSYSGMGIAYVQEVIEKVSGKPLESLGEELLFGPLQMTSSSFAGQPRLAERTANGHLWGVVPGLIWAVVYPASLVVVAVVGWPLVRLVTGRWRPRKRAVVIAAVIGLALPIVGVFALLGSAGLTEFAWVIGLYGTAAVVGLVVAYAAVGRAIERLLPRRSGARVMAKAGLVLLLLAGWGALSIGLRNLPVPAWPTMPPHGAGSVRSTAGDLSRFLIELARPTLLSPEIAAELRASQVRLSDDLSWGLGPGILHGAEGDAVWQWGQHIDFQSVMIVYPESGLGAVVLTNSDLLNPDVAVTIAQRAVGRRIEPLLRAIHLEFDSPG